jgi:hypothetical protein
MEKYKVKWGERGGSVSSGLAHGVAAGKAAVVLKSTDAPGLLYADYLMYLHSYIQDVSGTALSYPQIPSISTIWGFPPLAV